METPSNPPPPPLTLSPEERGIVDAMAGDARAYFEARAAALEFGGGKMIEEAESVALAETVARFGLKRRGQ